MLSLRKPREAPEDGYKSHVKEKMRVGKLLQEKKEEKSLDCFSSGLSRVREERENQKKRAREDIEEKVSVITVFFKKVKSVISRLFSKNPNAI